MKALAIVFKVLGYAWLAMFSLVWVLCMVLIFIKDGWWKVAEILSPFNFANVLVTVLSALPGIVCLKVADYFEKRSGK